MFSRTASRGFLSHDSQTNKWWFYKWIKVQSITNSTPKDKFKPCPKTCSACASAYMACRTLVISRTLTFGKSIIPSDWENCQKFGKLLTKTCCRNLAKQPSTFSFNLTLTYLVQVCTKEKQHTRDLGVLSKHKFWSKDCFTLLLLIGWRDPPKVSFSEVVRILQKVLSQ